MDAHVDVNVVDDRARHRTADGDNAMTTSSFASLLPPPRNVIDMMVGRYQLIGGLCIFPNPKHQTPRCRYKFYLLARPYA